jgi:hypothetical protein
MHKCNLLIYRAVITIVLFGTILSFLSGAEYLEWRVKILFGFHLATIIAWVGLTATSLLAISINRKNAKLRAISSFSFYISIFWLLTSYLLAGNNNLIFSFSRQFAFYTWIVISSVPIVVLLFSIFYNISWKIIKSYRQDQL